MPERLAGRVALVTGSGRNIGRAIALLFAAEGARVIVNGHSDKNAVDSVVGEIEASGGQAVGVMADVSDPDQVAMLVHKGSAAFGPIDIAVNNVGRRLRRPLDEISITEWQETINHNLNSAFYVTHYVLPAMRERGGGRLINISGYDGWTGHIGQRARSRFG
ncbi:MULTISPECIES: SDR family NAD(P)-dependent oxidoreductase [Nocardia]|uniref:3-oxoacyl-[acyl-carrier-protein] reductase MabA n=1 Tax=Nocardia sputorum TaxID=2984338 RepID=A0ABN6U1D6_9NOCA|nr:SDR family NAD(P)-dependent oxidoreductase [Nocardia sputorum]BDT90371.1 hypothetical protein IFM12275_03470 [Nocardia sputorum]BDT98990.1 hypothetical protein IFM12276_20190 [Nocardia sputorum]